jgi:polyisoprenoid-binding protein YceI
VAADPDATVRRAEVTIPVQALDCANGTMNGHLRKALRAAESPTIRFRLNDVSEKGTGAVRMSGTLSIAGRENPVAIDATVARDAQGRLRVKGSKQLRMTEFGVTPPTLMMGTMKVHDPVVVGFDVLLNQ